jgi:hypothetical protein
MLYRSGLHERGLAVVIILLELSEIRIGDDGAVGEDDGGGLG